jgi:hypothetical protein
MQEDPNNDVKGANHQHKRTNTKGVEWAKKNSIYKFIEL